MVCGDLFPQFRGRDARLLLHDAFDIAVLRNQLGGGFGVDAEEPWDVVRRIARDGFEIDHGMRCNSETADNRIDIVSDRFLSPVGVYVG